MPAGAKPVDTLVLGRDIPVRCHTARAPTSVRSPTRATGAVPLIVDEAPARTCRSTERLDQAVLDRLTTGLAAGMTIPDAADRGLKTIRVTAV